VIWKILFEPPLRPNEPGFGAVAGELLAGEAEPELQISQEPSVVGVSADALGPGDRAGFEIG
jgi:hypothetical protein